MPITAQPLFAAQPIVFNDGTMVPHFRDFMLRVNQAVEGAEITASWGFISGTLSNQADLQTALNTAGTTAVWGSITGTLSSQTDLQTALTTIPTSSITSGTFDDARIAESNVTQHEAALTITESQISDLDHTDAAAVHVDVAAEISGVTEKTAVVDADLVLIEDSEASNAKKRVQRSNLLRYAPPTVRDEATDPYTLVLADANKVLRFTTASAAVTIPVEASVAFPTGTEISIRQAGTGTLVLTTTSLTINGSVPGWAQHVEVKFRKVGSDTWDVV